MAADQGGSSWLGALHHHHYQQPVFGLMLLAIILMASGALASSGSGTWQENVRPIMYVQLGKFNLFSLLSNISRGQPWETFEP